MNIDCGTLTGTLENSGYGCHIIVNNSNQPEYTSNPGVPNALFGSLNPTWGFSFTYSFIRSDALFMQEVFPRQVPGLFWYCV